MAYRCMWTLRNVWCGNQAPLSSLFLDMLHHLVVLPRSLCVASETRRVAHQCLWALRFVPSLAAHSAPSYPSWRQRHSLKSGTLASTYPVNQLGIKEVKWRPAQTKWHIPSARSPCQKVSSDSSTYPVPSSTVTYGSAKEVRWRVAFVYTFPHS